MLLLTYYPIPLDHFVHMVLFFHCAAADDDNDNYDDDDPVLHHKVRGRDWMLWQNTPSSGGGKKQLLVPILATTWSFLMDSFLKKAFWGDVSTRRKNMTSTFFKKNKKQIKTKTHQLNGLFSSQGQNKRDADALWSRTKLPLRDQRGEKRRGSASYIEHVTCCTVCFVRRCIYTKRTTTLLAELAFSPPPPSFQTNRWNNWKTDCFSS